MSEDTTLHTKYRPTNLDSLLGHTTAVTRLKGMVSTGKVPGCLLFTGPASVGKTTLARALAASINGKPVDQQQSDYKELNGGDQRSIDDMRELIRISKYKPQGKKRIIVIDEAQQIVSNSAACLEATTKVITNKGSIEAKELHERLLFGEIFEVASFNHKTFKLEWKPIIISRAKLSDENSISISEARLTANHQMFTQERGYTNVSETNGLTGLKLKIE